MILNKYIYFRFQYKWTATVPGTNWYHSHVAFQRGDGLLGMYIVRLPPEEEVHSQGYDYDLTDHHIIAQEWFHGVGKILQLRFVGNNKLYLKNIGWCCMFK